MTKGSTKSVNNFMSKNSRKQKKYEKKSTLICKYKKIWEIVFQKILSSFTISKKCWEKSLNNWHKCFMKSTRVSEDLQQNISWFNYREAFTYKILRLKNVRLEMTWYRNYWNFFSTLAKNIVVQVTEKRIRTHNHLSS